MRLPKRGERGFTLIELLIVVAILGVLAAVVIPNVTRFVGAGEEEAAETELHNVQLAVTSMMLENGITSIPASLTEVGAAAQNNMNLFPDTTTPAVEPLPWAPNKGYTGVGSPIDGYRLHAHDIVNPEGQGFDTFATVNYVTVQFTTYYYTCEADGTVKQWADVGTPLKPIVWD